MIADPAPPLTRTPLLPSVLAANALGRIECIPIPDFRTFQREIIPAGRPVVIRGLMREQPAFERWTLPYLRQTLGPREIMVSEVEGDKAMYERDPVAIPFDAFVDELLAQTPPAIRHYLTVGNVMADGSGRWPSPLLPELSADVRAPSVIQGLPVVEGNFWLGFDGIVTPLHFDTSENLLGVIRGCKRLVLFAPEETDNLYPPPILDMTHESAVDLGSPDFERFPLLQRAQYWTCDLEPGDMLFMPSGWWHYVKSEGLNLAVNFWWAGSVLRYLRPPQSRVLAGGVMTGRIARKIAHHVRFKLGQLRSGAHTA